MLSNSKLWLAESLKRVLIFAVIRLILATPNLFNTKQDQNNGSIYIACIEVSLPAPATKRRNLLLTNFITLKTITRY